MVRGLYTFRAFFKDFAGSYVIIGGTACNESDKKCRKNGETNMEFYLFLHLT